MSATLRVYFHGVIEAASRVFRFGSAVDPIEAITVDGDSDASPSQITVAAGTTVVLWAYKATDPSFALFHAKLLSGDYAAVSVLVCKDSGSAALPVATATRAWRWRHTDLATHAPIVLSSDNAYMNDDAATTASDTGNTLTAGYTVDNQSGIDGSLPTLWAGAATPIAGRIYKIVVHNPHATDDIVVEYGKVV